MLWLYIVTKTFRLWIKLSDNAADDDDADYDDKNNDDDGDVDDDGDDGNDDDDDQLELSWVHPSNSEFLCCWVLLCPRPTSALPLQRSSWSSS